MPLVTDITAEDLTRLETFLQSDATPDSAMSLTMLEGYLTALVIGPRIVMPSAWLPCVWDCQNHAADPTFDNAEQVDEIMGLIFGLMNRVVGAFESAPAQFKPLFDVADAESASAWCAGFLQGAQFNKDDWTNLWLPVDVGGSGHVSMMTPLLRLGDEFGWALTMKDGTAQHWIERIVPALVSIHAYWQERQPMPPEAAHPAAPVRREGPKVGRNDPCPCGSGQKYKKCCDKARTLH